MVDQNSHKAELQELKEWFQSNPNLPEEIDPIVLKRFFKCMYYDVEETKKLIELNYDMRNKNPDIFINRDPEEDKTQKALNASDIVPLPGLTKDRHKVLLFRMTDMDPNTRNSIEESKIFFMLADCRFTMVDADSEDDLKNRTTASTDEIVCDSCLADGDVQLVDIAGYTMRHLTKISMFIFRVYLKFLQEAYPVRLKAMHVINCPSMLNRMIAFVRPFMNEEVYKLIHFHKDGLESLYEYIPPEMLPKEYGGTCGTMADLKAKSLMHFKEKRDYLMDPKYWVVKKEPAARRSRWSWW